MKSMKKGIFFFLSILIFLSILVLPSCEKDYPHYTIRPELLPYAIFYEGSYWIYQNDSTGELDSAFCENPYQYTNGGKDYERYWDFIDLFFKSKIIKNWYLGYYCTGHISDIGYTDKMEIGIKKNNGAIYTYIAIFPSLSPNTIVDYPCDWQNYEFFYEIIDQYELNGIEFQKVIHSTYRSKEPATTNPNYEQIEFFMVPYVGMVKFTEINFAQSVNRSWSIVRYQVINESNPD
jgi:hypothetical protein